MTVKILGAAEWPFPGLIAQLAGRGGRLGATRVGQDEIDRQNQVRDHIANGINAVPGGAAITEIAMTATLSQLRADADIVARGPSRPRAAAQAFFEVKTGPFSEIRVNQRYVYALALVGDHVKSNSPKLPRVGLTPGQPMPAMDFLLMSADPPNYHIIPSLILASEVNKAASVELIMGTIAALERLP